MGKDIFRDFDEELAGIIEHERGIVGYIARNTRGASEGEEGLLVTLPGIPGELPKVKLRGLQNFMP